MTTRDHDAFPHRKLDVCRVAREAMVVADRMARGLPRGYATLADQLRRSSQSAYLQSVEGAARSGAEQLLRFRGARAEACEAAGVVEGLLDLKVVDPAKAEELIGLLGRVAAMLTKMSGLRS